MRDAKRRNPHLKPFNPLVKIKLGESVADKSLEMTAQLCRRSRSSERECTLYTTPSLFPLMDGYPR
jgi:hypothetical protein